MKSVVKEKTDARAKAGPVGRSLPFVSVVVATIGRGRLLIQTVRGLLENDYPNFEVIVVDQTPQPERDVLRFMEGDSARIRYVRRRQPGLPDARNAGVGAARGDIVLFVDDDVVVGPSLIAAHARAYADSAVGGVAGRVLPPGDTPRETEHRPARIAKVRYFGLVIRDHFDADVRTEADHVRGCNMSFLRRAITDAGGFDGRFGGSAHLEETDLAFRVRAAGYRLVFEPEASLVHLLEAAGGCRPRNPGEWFFWYGHNVCLFYRKNFPSAFFALSSAYFAARLGMSAIKNRDIHVVVWGIEGFIRGLKTYRRGAA
jgi:GT2 family glycosyltransferase